MSEYQVLGFLRALGSSTRSRNPKPSNHDDLGWLIQEPKETPSCNLAITYSLSWVKMQVNNLAGPWYLLMAFFFWGGGEKGSLGTSLEGAKGLSGKEPQKKA